MSDAPHPPPDIPFTPVPVRARRDGWTPARQREMVAVLARLGSVTGACRAVGKSPRSYYNLLLRPGAESFAAACDRAMEMGRDAVRDAIIDRCFNGALVPIYRRGRLTGMRHRYFDRLAISVLGGRGRPIEQVLEDRMRGRRYADANREIAAEKRAREEQERLYQEQLDALVDKGRSLPKWRPPPRIRGL